MDKDEMDKIQDRIIEELETINDTVYLDDPSWTSYRTQTRNLLIDIRNTIKKKKERVKRDILFLEQVEKHPDVFVDLLIKGMSDGEIEELMALAASVIEKRDNT